MIAGTDIYAKFSHAEELPFTWEIPVSVASRNKLVLGFDDLPSLLWGWGQGCIFLCQYFCSQVLELLTVASTLTLLSTV